MYHSSKSKTSVACISQTCGEEVWGLVGGLTPARSYFYSCWSSRNVIRMRETHVDWDRGQQRPAVRPLLGYRMDRVRVRVGSNAMRFAISTKVNEEDMLQSGYCKCKAKAG